MVILRNGVGWRTGGGQELGPFGVFARSGADGRPAAAPLVCLRRVRTYKPPQGEKERRGVRARRSPSGPETALQTCGAPHPTTGRRSLPRTPTDEHLRQNRPKNGTHPPDTLMSILVQPPAPFLPCPLPLLHPLTASPSASTPGSRSRGCCPGRGRACSSSRRRRRLWPSLLPSLATIFIRSARAQRLPLLVGDVDLAVLGGDVGGARGRGSSRSRSASSRRRFERSDSPIAYGKYSCGFQPVTWHDRHSGSKCRGGSSFTSVSVA